MHISKRLITLLLFSLFALATAAETKTITFVEMSDLHSFIAGKLHKANQGTLGQIIQFYESVKLKNPNSTYFISSGDNHQGTALSDAEEPMPGVTNVELLFDYLGNDFISAIGNHDIQGKHPEWIRAQAHGDTNYFGDRYLATGLKFKNSTTNEHSDYLTNTRWTFRTIDGVKVMFFSILDKDWDTYPEWLQNTDPLDTIDAEFVAAYNAEKPDLIIDLIHAGLYTDRAHTTQYSWIQELNEKIRNLTVEDIPILNLHGHDHQTYESTCVTRSNKTIENCYAYDIRANFLQVGVINVNLTRDSDATPYNMSLARKIIPNTISDLSNYLEVPHLGCNDTCKAVNDKIVDLATRVHLLDHVADTDQAYILPNSERRWFENGTTYSLFFEKLATRVYGEQPFYVCPSGMMKGGLPKGKVIRNDLFSYAAYDNKMAYITGITPKVLWGVMNLDGEPTSDDPADWSFEPTTTKDTHYVYPNITDAKADDVYNLFVSDYDVTNIEKACARFKANCTTHHIESVSNRDLIHQAIQDVFPVQEDVEIDNSGVKKPKMPSWAWVLVALAVVLALGIFVGAFFTAKKRSAKKVQV